MAVTVSLVALPDEVRIAATGVLVFLNDPRAGDLEYDLRGTIAMHRIWRDMEARNWEQYGYPVGSSEGGGLVESAAERARDPDREDS